jgi:predicted AlkP superfamily pyrophosphatase or phosphodiesterase
MRLILISLDAVYAADAEFLLSLPALGKLAQEGVFCDRVQTIYPSLTYPIHASLVTGCYPEHHGILHNQPFQPETEPKRRTWYWDASDIRVETLFNQAHAAGRECAALLWPTTGHARHIKYNFPEVLALPGENQALKVLRYGSTRWLLGSELRYGKRRVSYSQPHLDDYITFIAESLIQRHYVPTSKLGKREDIIPSKRQQARHMPDMLALHLVDCDATRHHYGTFSEEAKQSLMRLDERVGRLMNELSRRDLLKDTIIAVVSDHGQSDITASLPLDAWLQANKIPARAQTLGFGAYIHLRRGDYLPVLNALREHKELLHIRHIYTREELRVLHAAPDLLLAVEAEEGLVYVDNDEEVNALATHGFGPHHPGSRVLLWLSGPQFASGMRLDQCNIVDIAPTLAIAAGLILPRAQGRVLQETFL